MKILMITHYFYSNEIASIRPQKLSKYICEKDNVEITLLTCDNNGETIEENKIKKINVEEQTCLLNDFINKHSKINKQNNLINTTSKPCIKEKKSASRKIKDFLNYYNGILLSKKYVISAKKKYIKEILNEKYDVVWSTYGPMFPHKFARIIKKKQKGIVWIADYRDQALTPFVPKLLRHYYRGFDKKNIKLANLVSCISDGIPETFKVKKKCEIITNGFDESDSIINGKSNSKMTIVYAGSLYYGKRDLEPVFKAFRDLIDERKVEDSKIEIIYLGETEEICKAWAIEYNVNHILNCPGFVSREESLSYQAKSDILLLASWNDKNYNGIMTGKFLEYMGSRKPILATISGDLPNSCIKEIIEEGNLGFCYEEVSKEKDYDKLKQFILDKYNEFINDGECSFEPKEEVIQRYNYKNISDKLYDIMVDLVGKRGNDK